MTQEALKQLNLALETMEAACKRIDELVAENKALKEALAQTQEPWCMKMNGCKTKCEDCPVEVAQPEQEPVAYDKTEMNCFVQDLYDKKMKEGKHGHYETMFHVVHQAIKRVPPQRTEPVIDKSAAIRIATVLGWTPPRTWVGLTDGEIDELHGSPMNLEHSGALKWVRIIEARLKQKNGYAEEKNT